MSYMYNLNRSFKKKYLAYYVWFALVFLFSISIVYFLKNKLWLQTTKPI